MKLFSLVVAMTFLLAQAIPASAADGLPGATVRSDSGMTPAERRARFDQWCKDNPDKCREMKAKAEQRREQCKADPEKCRAEMQAQREQWCKSNPEKCRELQAQREQRFKKADTNGDGRLSREEAQKGMPGVARHFDAIDANKDGVVTMEELQAMRKVRGGSRTGPGGSIRPATMV